MKTITKQQYYALIGFRTIAETWLNKLDDLNKISQEITGEVDPDGNPDFYGHTSDFIYGSRELDEMLRILEISVEEDK